MRVIAPIPKQFEDSNGVPYANGKVTVYLHNSTSLAQIYKEAEGGTLAPNPTILDSHGAWNAFVTSDTAYDYVIQDEHDNVIFSYSNVSVTGLGTASESIYELAMFDLSQVGNGLYNDINADLGKGMLPIISAGSQGTVRYYYYMSRDSQAHTMTFTCGYNGRVEFLVLKNDDTYEFTSIAKSVLIAKANYVEGDDNVPTKTFQYIEMSRVGDDVKVDENHGIRLNKGVYHVSLVVHINVNPTEESRPWIEEVTLNLPSGYGGVATLLDRSIRPPHSSSSPLAASFDYVVETDNTLFDIHLAGLGNNCYATLKPISIHKIAEVE